MTEKLHDTWQWRELPVLREAARILEEGSFGQGARLHEIASATRLDIDDIVRAAHWLEDDALIEVTWVSPQTHARVVALSGEARRQVGQWPSPESSLDRIVRALEAIAGDKANPVHEEAVQAFQAFRRAGPAFGAVARAAITGEMP